MNKKGNNYTLNISLKLNKHKYFPSDMIDGEILVQLNKQIKLNNILESAEFHIILKENIFYEYFEKRANSFILDKKILKYKNNKNLDNTLILKIPFNYKLPEASIKNFFPSFRYITESAKCLISHSIIVEIPFISNKSSTNIFIRKIPLNKIEKNKNNNTYTFGEELIKNYFLFNAGRLAYYIRHKKSITYKDKFEIEIHIDERELGEIKLESIQMKIKKQINFFKQLNIFFDKIEENFNIKKLLLNNINSDIRNNTINESFSLPKTEFIPLSLNDIQNINFLNSNFNFTPPVNNILFKCEYFLEINFSFDSKLIPDKIITIPIDFYDCEYNIQKRKNNEININKNSNIIKKYKKNNSFTNFPNKQSINKINKKKESSKLTDKDILQIFQYKSK